MKYAPERIGETMRYGVTQWKFRIRKMRFEHGRYRYYLGMNASVLTATGMKYLKEKRVWEWLGICKERCPECGEYVPDFFDHIDADCPLV